MILDGKKLADQILQEQKQLILAQQLHPKLLIVQIGENPASVQYVALKKKRGEEIGIMVVIEQLSDDTTFNEIKTHIEEVVENEPTTGILIQLPLPQNLPTQETLDLVPPEQDIDGLTSKNLAGLSTGNYLFAPAVAVGIMQFIASYNIPIAGKSVVVLGKGPYVGKPIADMIEQKYNVPVVRVDINTPHPKELLKNADVVISCIGKPHLYSVTDLKQRAVLIDVGTSMDPRSGKIVGDFDKAQAEEYLSAYTPVPGGVGPMTVASLLKNVIEANFNEK